MSLTSLSLNNATVACDKWMLVKGHDHCIIVHVRHRVELNTSSKYLRAGSSHIHHKGEIQAYFRKTRTCSSVAYTTDLSNSVSLWYISTSNIIVNLAIYSNAMQSDQHIK